MNIAMGWLPGDAAEIYGFDKKTVCRAKNAAHVQMAAYIVEYNHERNFSFLFKFLDRQAREFFVE
jgi:hypothetical protein